MTRRFAITLAFFLAFAATVQAADNQLIQELKQMGQAVDNMSMHISKAVSDEEAAQMAQATQQAFATHFTGNPKPQVSVTASAGRCNVLITAPQWKLWSNAENGVIVDHGATIN